MQRQESSRNLSITVFLMALSLGITGCAREMDQVALPDEEMSEDQGQLADGTGENTAEEVLPDEPTPPSTPAQRDQVLAKYSHLDPNRIVPENLLSKTVLYFDVNKAKFPNKDYISVIDFAKRSTQARFFIINLQTGAVWALRVSHGKGTDPEHDGYANPSLFSNKPGTNASSRGHYKTAETYYGAHGLSLRLDGLSSTNSKARSRAIVIHGATYVKESPIVQGRSWGCPAVSMENRDEVIRRLRHGSLIYAGLST